MERNIAQDLMNIELAKEIVGMYQIEVKEGSNGKEVIENSGLNFDTVLKDLEVYLQPELIKTYDDDSWL